MEPGQFTETIQGREFVCRMMNLKAPRLPVVLGFVVTHYSYPVFGGQTRDLGQCVLLLRRGFGLYSMPGLWSVVAGFDDIVKPCHADGGDLNPIELRELRMFNETQTETGIPPEDIERIVEFGVRDQPNLGMPGQLFVQHLMCVTVKSVPNRRPVLDWEHTGAVFVPVASIRNALLDPRAQRSEVLGMVVKDGVVPGFWEGMELLCAHLRE